MVFVIDSIAIWKDDPEIYSPDNLGYFLLLEVDADLDEVIFYVSSLDGDDVSASIGNKDEKVHLVDAIVTEMEKASNKVSALSRSSTNMQYAGAKSVVDYIDDIVGDVEALLAAI